MDTAALIRDAETAMDGKDPEHGWPINNGFERADPVPAAGARP
jgi:hypothetical protein